MPTNKGAFKIFTLAGIGVFVHWSWFLVAVYSIQFRTHAYSSIIWNVLEYLSPVSYTHLSARRRRRASCSRWAKTRRCCPRCANWFRN